MHGSDRLENGVTTRVRSMQSRQRQGKGYDQLYAEVPQDAEYRELHDTMRAKYARKSRRSKKSKERVLDDDNDSRKTAARFGINTESD